ncbi:MAG: DNA-directed polymerase [Verrucomicrobiales bacterium]|nr:DNA-directed polymerase [Verrucomicrobiales bacterium]
MTFKNLPVKSPAAVLLQRSLEKGRVGHGYLFQGSRLEELAQIAGIFAKTLNCQQPVTGESGKAIDCCDKCSSCLRIESLNHPDVMWIRPEMKSRIISVDQIRNMMQTLNLKPTEASYKVGIIAAADRMQAIASNAFLKTLEEPPARSILILLSTEPQRLLDTILSRCLRLSFSDLSAEQVEAPQWLHEFAAVAAENKAGILSRYAMLGKLASQLSNAKTGIKKDLTAKSPLKQYTDVDAKVRDQWEEELDAAIEAEYRRVRSVMIDELEWWMRDVWMSTLAYPEFRYRDLQEHAAKVSARIKSSDALQNIEVLEATQRRLFTNVQESLALEVGLLNLKLG